MRDFSGVGTYPAQTPPPLGDNDFFFFPGSRADYGPGGCFRRQDAKPHQTVYHCGSVPKLELLRDSTPGGNGLNGFYQVEASGNAELGNGGFRVFRAGNGNAPQGGRRAHPDEQAGRFRE